MDKKFTYKMLYSQDLSGDLNTLNAWGSLGYKVVHIEKVTEYFGLCHILLMKEE